MRGKTIVSDEGDLTPCKTRSLQIEDIRMEADYPRNKFSSLTPTHAITSRQVRHKKHLDNDKYTLESSIYSLLYIPGMSTISANRYQNIIANFVPIDGSLFTPSYLYLSRLIS